MNWGGLQLHGPPQVRQTFVGPAGLRFDVPLANAIHQRVELVD
jgi:hypothetical protein